MRLELIPVTLTDAKRLVTGYHEHNEAAEGWKFGTGIAADGELVGAAMVGRPTGRGLNQYRTVEITRLVITEKGRYKNAASMLYGAACRMAEAGGYIAAYTYTLKEEDAASVRAAGFIVDAVLDARATSEWGSSRPRYEETLLGPRKRPEGPKVRWIRYLRKRTEGVRELGIGGAGVVVDGSTGRDPESQQQAYIDKARAAIADLDATGERT
jgi:hypothetical protein